MFVVIIQCLLYLVAEMLPLDGYAHQRLISYYYGAEKLEQEFMIVIYISLALGLCIYYSKDLLRMFTDSFRGFYSVLSGRRSFRVTSTNFKMFNIFVTMSVMTIIVFPLLNLGELDFGVDRVAVIFLVTALILRLSTSFTLVKVDGRYLDIKEILVLSLVQIIGLIPGFSRTAMLIGVGSFMGTEKKYLVKLVLISFIPLLVLKLFFMGVPASSVFWIVLERWYLLLFFTGVVMLLIKLLYYIVFSNRFYKFYLYLAGIGIWTLLDVYFSKRGL
ncbi:MAG: undecaprenyl-diphosphate phosphatase [Oligoflexia bacterium]|nr:undecaprenyl-diphosphate phosphatase [Oligoflexia bacterium]